MAPSSPESISFFAHSTRSPYSRRRLGSLAFVSAAGFSARRTARPRLAVIWLYTRIRIHLRLQAGWRKRAGGSHPGSPNVPRTDGVARGHAASRHPGRDFSIDGVAGWPTTHSTSRPDPQAVRWLFRGAIPHAGAIGIMSRDQRRRQSGNHTVGATGATFAPRVRKPGPQYFGDLTRAHAGSDPGGRPPSRYTISTTSPTPPLWAPTPARRRTALYAAPPFRSSSA